VNQLNDLQAITWNMSSYALSSLEEWISHELTAIEDELLVTHFLSGLIKE
jgi:hypothetical protein